MKSIIIHDKNIDKINEFLKKEQGRAKERIIESYEDLTNLIVRYTKKIRIPKKHWEKCTLIIRVGAGHFPNKYKYIPMGTVAKIEFRKDGKGELVSIKRENVKDKKEYVFNFTENAKKAVLENMNIF